MAVFTLRPMTSADKPVIMGIASRTWEGGDYLPFVFDDWIADTGGEFVAASLEGRVVGCGKLTFVTPHDAWFEGLRKDPDVTEGGLAETLDRYYLGRLAGKPGLRSIRFSTSAFNERSIAVSERMGFRRRHTFTEKDWTAKRDELGRTAGPRAGRAAVVRDPAEVRRFVEASSWLEATGSVVCEGWRVYPYSWEWFRNRYLDPGRCLGVLEGGRLAGLAAFVHDTRFPQTYVKLAFIDAEDRGTADALFDALIGYVKEHAQDENVIEGIFPPGVRVSSWAEDRCFRTWEQENNFYVYELPLDLLAGFAEGG